MISELNLISLSKEKEKKIVFEVKQLQFGYFIVLDWAHSNLIFAFDGHFLTYGNIF